jgi:hypothetical protein
MYSMADSSEQKQGFLPQLSRTPAFGVMPKTGRPDIGRLISWLAV